MGRDALFLPSVSKTLQMQLYFEGLKSKIRLRFKNSQTSQDKVKARHLKSMRYQVIHKREKLTYIFKVLAWHLPVLDGFSQNFYTTIHFCQTSSVD